jgi:hypothetical protein
MRGCYSIYTPLHRRTVTPESEYLLSEARFMVLRCAVSAEKTDKDEDQVVMVLPIHSVAKTHIVLTIMIML